jgi:hypothetical protein
MNACNHSHFVDPYTAVEEGHNFFEISEPWYAPLHFCALKAHKVSLRSCKPNTKVKPNETPLQRNICCGEETKGDPVLSPNKASHKICLGLILFALFEDHYLLVSKKN